MIKIFGIRHHGPGSAISVIKAMEHWQPDVLLVEIPADAQSLAQDFAHKGLLPPVSILIYNPTDLKQAAYLPFADFSPEWGAIRCALKNQIPVRFMDLPMSYAFVYEQLTEANPELLFEKNEGGLIESYSHDPLGHMARLAGYEDSERWWEHTFENHLHPVEIFDTILEMISALREALPDNRPETLRREAHMCTVIRAAQKDGFQRIAVVCGAWHAPALYQPDLFNTKKDAQFLKGIRKIKTKAAWIPWSYERLSYQSGYGAGVLSPAWYEMIFSHRSEAVAHWMSMAGHLLRQEDLPASTANLVEAVRLADVLAAMRGLVLPGIIELREAAMSTLTHGGIQPLRLIEQHLIVGEKFGSIPPDFNVVPLQRDLDAAIQSLRLGKDQRSLTAVDKTLDLRKEIHLQVSRLLYRLSILGILWGQKLEHEVSATSSFREIWRLKWQPDFSIAIIEAGIWGNTVETAATNCLLHKARIVEDLPQLTVQVEAALFAHLPDAIPLLIARLQEVSALTEDALHLMNTLPTLSHIVRYGDVRKTDTSAVRIVVDEIIPRMCIGLPALCIGVDREAAVVIFEQILKVHHSISLLRTVDHLNTWHTALRQIITIPRTHPQIRGACTRILFDKEVISLEETAGWMHFGLSEGNPVADAAAWIEGFLFGSGLLLVHQPSLWCVLDQWVASIPADHFKVALPVLRRTFSNFSPAERRKMLALAKSTGGAFPVLQPLSDEYSQQEELVLPTLKMLLGDATA